MNRTQKVVAVLALLFSIGGIVLGLWLLIDYIREVVSALRSADQSFLYFGIVPLAITIGTLTIFTILFTKSIRAFSNPVLYLQVRRLFLVYLLISSFLSVYVFFEERNTSAPARRSMEFVEKLNLGVQFTGSITEWPRSVPSERLGAEWGLIEVVCEQGGYDLSLYAGKMVTFRRFSVNWPQGITPSDLIIMSDNDAVVCIYRVAVEGSNLIPGIWPFLRLDSID